MLTKTDYAARAVAAGYRMYFAAEGDREGNALKSYYGSIAED